MKHFGYSDHHWVRVATATLLLAATATACEKHDDIDFSGTVIDTRECTADMLRPSLGYVVELETPTDIGSDYTLRGVTHHNVVILYDPDRLIYKNDHLNGSFYLDDKYPRANCSVHWTDFNVPAGVFTNVDVD